MLLIQHLADINCNSQLVHDILTPDDNVDINNSGEYLPLFIGYVFAVTIAVIIILQSHFKSRKNERFSTFRLRPAVLHPTPNDANIYSNFCLSFENAFRFVALRQKHMEYQLEKSILSRESQGETPKASAAHKKHRRHRKHHRHHHRHHHQKKKQNQEQQPNEEKEQQPQHQQAEEEELGKQTRRRTAHDFNPFDMDYVDFGAVIGQNGAFSWHANYSPD